MAREYFWALITLVIAVILAIVLLSIFRDDPIPQEQLYQGVPLDTHLVELDKRSLEDAYRDHLKLLFSVWLKDDVSVVHRINEGLRRARRAYAEAAGKIQEREKALGK